MAMSLSSTEKDKRVAERQSTEVDIVQHVSKWLSTCNTHHACARTSLRSPTWLIDTRDHCIVPGSTGGPYIALSYTWTQNLSRSWASMGDLGPVPQGLQLLRGNLPSLSKTGALLQQCESFLPKVILDAFQLTQLLGLRYLWVDRLCIVQDQEETRMLEEVMGMDQVYEGACITVVAAATYGLFSTATATVSRPEYCLNARGSAWNRKKLSQSEVERPKFADIVRHHYEALSTSAWADRGWTYQESILSRRVVYFYNDMIFWHCECAVWDIQHLESNENSTDAARILSKLTFTKRFSAPSKPDFGLYIDLICPYNGRRFTDQKDGLSACLGILNRLAPAFQHGFLYGLPRLFLDYALLWQPLKTCTRRFSKSTRNATLPSWSWCGWECLIDPWSFQAGFCLDSNDTLRKEKARSWKLKHLVNWESIMQLRELVEIQKEAFEPKQAARTAKADSSTQLLNEKKRGKSRINTSGILWCCLSGLTEHAFFLPAANLRFRWVLINPYRQNCSLLAFFDPGLNEREMADLSNVIVLRDRTGVFSGLLRVTEDKRCEIGKDMELIAMSEGSATRGDLKNCFEEKTFRLSPYYRGRPFHANFDDDGWWVSHSDKLPSFHRANYEVLFKGDYEEDLILPREGPDDEVCEFYNVLWVQRGEDEIAHRVGCGRVLKDRWKQNEPRRTKITLG